MAIRRRWTFGRPVPPPPRKLTPTKRRYRRRSSTAAPSGAEPQSAPFTQEMEQTMGITAAHSPGWPNWFELATTDQAGARAFYAALFDWIAVDHPISDGQHYTIFEQDGAEVAACYTMMPDQVETGMPAHWAIYFQVEDCDATAARAVELGGKLLAEPFEVMEHLRMAVIADPSGAVFQIAQPRQHPGVGKIREDHAITWV